MKKLGLIFISCLVVSTFAFANEEAATATSESTVALAAKSEDQIPLNIDQVKKSSDGSSTSTRLMMTGLILSGLLGSAYYFVRKYKTSNSINKSNMQIKVLSQHYLGPKRSLAIIRVAGESILIGVTDTNISMIKSLSLLDDEVPAETPATFSAAMNQNSESTQKTQTHSTQEMKQRVSQANDLVGVDELEEEFSFAGFKDSVSKKLKSMRSI